MVAISRPKPRQVVTPGKKQSTFSRLAPIVGTVAGGIAGAIGAGPGGATAGASTGAGLGASIGGITSQLSNNASQGSVQNTQRGSQVDTGAVGRRLGGEQPMSDSLQSLGTSLTALGQAPQEIQQEYLGTLSKAFQQEYNNTTGIA